MIFRSIIRRRLNESRYDRHGKAVRTVLNNEGPVSEVAN